MTKFVFQNEEGTFVIRSQDTVVYLTEKEMSVFIWIRKYWDIWEKLKELKGGSVTLHCNHIAGNIRNEEWSYKKPRSP